MGPSSDFSNLLFRIRLLVFEVCETLVFTALVLCLAFYTIKHIVEFGWKLL
jgi:hypothetical protein